MEKWKNLGRLATVEFWDLALARALRSFLQGLIVAGVGGLTPLYELDWLPILVGGVGMAAASLITSMIFVLPEEQS